MTNLSDDVELEPYDPISETDVIVFQFLSVPITLSKIRYLTFTLIGVALLWPWNCFLSASAYYGQRFANTILLIKMYSSTMMSVSTLTSTGFNYYLSQVQAGVNYNRRIVLGLTMTIFVFIIMAVSCVSLLFIEMNDVMFFVILMFMVFISAVATCYAQNGTMATVNVLGGVYANAVMVGQGLAGVLPSVALIISILVVGEKPESTHKYVDKDYGVFVYYITASLISLACIGALNVINHQTNKVHYNLLAEPLPHSPANLNSPQITEQEPIIQKNHIPFGQLWSKLKFIVLTIFLTFSITLIFPVFASTVESVHINSKHRFFNKTIYIPFVYLIWNLGDLISRILCGTPNSRLLIHNPKTLIIYAVARLIFIPLFLSCNIHPNIHQSSALINSDLWYIGLQFLFGFSNGQLSTSSFMVVGDFCDSDEEKEAAGGFTTIFLSTGLAFGSVFSYALVVVIN